MTEIEVPVPPLTFFEGFKYCRDPRLLLFHFRHVKRRVEFVAALVGTLEERVRCVIHEIEHDFSFLEQFLGKHYQVLGRLPRGTDFMYLARDASSPYFFLVAEYAIVRLLAPEVIVETGGTPGNSSAFLLRALDRNGKGRLVTVDLPPSGDMDTFTGPEGKRWHAVMPEGMSSGWVIPDSLRGHYQLVLGDTKQVLPDVLDDLDAIGIFIHDSDHSYDHMMWEYDQAWPLIKPGGVLLSDDIGTNHAFDDFAARVALPPRKLGNFGGIVKPSEQA